MARKKIAAGNWKMNTTLKEATSLASGIAKKVVGTKGPLIIIAPPFTHLTSVKSKINRKARVKLAAQNCAAHEKGAFTGAISVDMLDSIGVDYVIIGHSERRSIFKETDATIAKKADLVLSRNMQPIFCCGEPLSVRKAKKHKKLVADQIKKGLFHLPAKLFKKVVIAYEPVWAIGTGVTATPEQAQEMHAYLRDLIAKKYGASIAKNTSILYGGSVKPANAKELFANKDVDGGLVGGASLKAADFTKIIKSF